MFVLAILVFQAIIGVVRWRIVIRINGFTLPLRLILRIYLEGMFSNQALPSTIGGDSVRIYRFVKAGVPLGGGVKDVFLDRLGGFLVLFIIMISTLPLFIQRVDDIVVNIAISALIGIGIVCFSTLYMLDFLPVGRRFRLVQGAVTISAGFRRLLGNVNNGVPLIGISILGQVLNVVVIYVIALGIGIQVSFVDCLIVVPTIILLASIPISIAGWDFRKAAMVSGFSYLHVETSSTLGLSILFGISMLVVGLSGGVLSLHNSDRRLINPGDLESK